MHHLIRKNGMVQTKHGKLVKATSNTGKTLIKRHCKKYGGTYNKKNNTCSNPERASFIRSCKKDKKVPHFRTKRCVLSRSSLGMSLILDYCGENRVYNPMTSRCILKKSKTSRDILNARCKIGKVFSISKNRCVKDSKQESSIVGSDSGVALVSSDEDEKEEAKEEEKDKSGESEERRKEEGTVDNISDKLINNAQSDNALLRDAGVLPMSNDGVIYNL